MQVRVVTPAGVTTASCSWVVGLVRNSETTKRAKQRNSETM